MPPANDVNNAVLKRSTSERRQFPRIKFCSVVWQMLRNKFYQVFWFDRSFFVARGFFVRFSVFSGFRALALLCWSCFRWSCFLGSRWFLQYKTLTLKTSTGHIFHIWTLLIILETSGSRLTVQTIGLRMVSHQFRFLKFNAIVFDSLH